MSFVTCKVCKGSVRADIVRNGKCPRCGSLIDSDTAEPIVEDTGKKVNNTSDVPGMLKALAELSNDQITEMRRLIAADITRRQQESGVTPLLASEAEKLKSEGWTLADKPKTTSLILGYNAEKRVIVADLGGCIMYMTPDKTFINALDEIEKLRASGDIPANTVIPMDKIVPPSAQQHGGCGSSCNCGQPQQSKPQQMPIDLFKSLGKNAQAEILKMHGDHCPPTCWCKKLNAPTMVDPVTGDVGGEDQKASEELGPPCSVDSPIIVDTPACKVQVMSHDKSFKYMTPDGFADEWLSDGETFDEWLSDCKNDDCVEEAVVPSGDCWVFIDNAGLRSDSAVACVVEFKKQATVYFHDDWRVVALPDGNFMSFGDEPGEDSWQSLIDEQGAEFSQRTQREIKKLQILYPNARILVHV